MVKYNNVTDRTIVLLIGALTSGLYLRTVAPGLLAGDPSEFQVAAWRLGLSHPTGYPFYMLIGSVWQHILALVGIAPAKALNLLNVFWGACSGMALYLLMLKWLPSSTSTIVRTSALFSATLLVTNPTFWNQSLIAEVYTLHILLMIFIFLVLPRMESSELDDQSSSTPETSSCHLVILSFTIGLTLTHHAMTLLLLPGLGLYLFLWNRLWWRSLRVVSLCFVAGLIPLLLYLYIPLRSGPTATPWYHQNLGGTELVLYTNTLESFLAYMTGQSISVGFHSMDEAAAQLTFAWTQWRFHMTWVGLLLMVAGVFALYRQHNWPLQTLLLLTLYLHQLFNLVYAIGDIHVYYIPLYLIGTILAGFGIAYLLQSLTHRLSAKSHPSSQISALLVIILFFLLPYRQATTYYDLIDQSSNNETRLAWEQILDASPPENAILISNDRNEIVPLFYLQYVEERMTNLRGLFPLIAPSEGFADIGATLDTAFSMAGDRPVYLIKPMPGLEVKYEMVAHTQPLVEVLGLVTSSEPDFPVNASYGPLRFLGYNWAEMNEQEFNKTDRKIKLTLFWQTQETLKSDYTTTVQIFDADQQKIVQHDASAGGVYYPTSIWKTDELLVEHYTLVIEKGEAAELLVGMYQGPAVEMLATPLTIALSTELE